MARLSWSPLTRVPMLVVLVVHAASAYVQPANPGGDADFGRATGPRRPEQPWNTPPIAPLSHQELPTSRPGSYPAETGVEITPPSARPCIGECSLYCSGPGFFRHPKDCSRFIRCVDNEEQPGQYQVYEFDCPAGLVFDELASTCNWPDQTEPCQSGGPKALPGGGSGSPYGPQPGGQYDGGESPYSGGPQPSTGVGPYSPSGPGSDTRGQQSYPGAAGPRGPANTALQPGGGGGGISPGGGCNPCKASGFFRHPDGCTKFIRCVDFHGDGRYTVFSFDCPEGLVFDERYNVCNWPHEAPPCDNVAPGGRCDAGQGSSRPSIGGPAPQPPAAPSGFGAQPPYGGQPGGQPPSYQSPEAEEPYQPGPYGNQGGPQWQGAPQSPYGSAGQNGPGPQNAYDRPQPLSQQSPPGGGSPPYPGSGPEGSGSPSGPSGYGRPGGTHQRGRQLGGSPQQGGSAQPPFSNAGSQPGSWQPQSGDSQDSPWQPQQPTRYSPDQYEPQNNPWQPQQGRPDAGGPQQGGGSWQPQQAPGGTPQGGSWNPQQGSPGAPYSPTGPYGGNQQPGPQSQPQTAVGPPSTGSSNCAAQCTSTGFFRNPQDCHKFYRCVDFYQNGQYTIFHFDCPAGLVFDERISVCNWPQNAPPCESSGGSGGGNSCPASSQPPSAPPPTQDLDQPPRYQSPAPQAGAPSAPAGGPPAPGSGPPAPAGGPPAPSPEAALKANCPAAGFFRNPQNCNKFYRCVDFWGNGDYTIFHFDCPGGLVFDERSSVCNWPDQAPPCDSAPSGPPALPGPPPAPAPAPAPAPQPPPAPPAPPAETPKLAPPAPTEPPTSEAPQTTAAPAETTPSPTTEKPEPRKSKPKRIKCPDKKNHEVPGDCTRFFRCEKVGVGKRAQLFKCMDGFIFDKATQFCKKAPPGFVCMSGDGAGGDEMGRAELAPPEMHLA